MKTIKVSYSGFDAEQSVDECLYDAIYNKAIDDFVKFSNTMPTVEEEDGTIRPMWLEEMAEQLKAGRENDNLRR